MTKIWKSRFKRYKKGSHYKLRRERIWLTLKKLNLRHWNTLEYKRKKRSKGPKWRVTPWRLNYKSKQEIKTFYGRISESTFKKYNNLAKPRWLAQQKKNLIVSWLEIRLDVTIFKLNWALSIFHAKQIILHGHVLVNGKVISTPSYLLKPSDIIEVSPQSRDIIKHYVLNKIKKIEEAHKRIYSWGTFPYPYGNLWYLKGKIEHILYLPLCLEVDYKTMSAILICYYENEQLMMYHPLKEIKHIKNI